VWRLWLRRLRRLRLWNLHDMDALGLDLVLLRNAPPPTPSVQVSLPGVMKFWPDGLRPAFGAALCDARL